MSLIHIPYKKDVRDLKKKLAHFLDIYESDIKYVKNTTTIVGGSAVYPLMNPNVGYITIKPLKKRKFTLFNEFLYKLGIISVAPTGTDPRIRHVIPIYSVNGTTINTYSISTVLFFNIVHFMYLQNKTLFKLVDILVNKPNFLYPTAVSGNSGLFLDYDLNGKPALMCASNVFSASPIIVFKQSSTCKNRSLKEYNIVDKVNNLAKKIKTRVNDVNVTLSKKDNDYSNIRITLFNKKDTNIIIKILEKKGLYEDNDFTVLYCKNQITIKMNVNVLHKYSIKNRSYSSNSDSSDNSESSDDSNNSSEESSDNSSDESSDSDSSDSDSEDNISYSSNSDSNSSDPSYKYSESDSESKSSKSSSDEDSNISYSSSDLDNSSSDESSSYSDSESSSNKKSKYSKSKKTKKSR